MSNISQSSYTLRQSHDSQSSEELLLSVNLRKTSPSSSPSVHPKSVQPASHNLSKITKRSNTSSRSIRPKPLTLHSQHLNSKNTCLPHKGFSDGYHITFTPNKSLNKHHVFIDRTPQIAKEILSVLDVSSWDDVTPSMLESIELLDVSHQEITQLQSEDFNGLTQLKTLRLEYNKICILPKNIFKDLSNLTLLMLNNNDIGELQQFHFNGLINIVSLFLGQNNLTSISKKTFHKLPQLKILSIENNNLKNLPDHIFDANDLWRLDIYGNPLTISLKLFNLFQKKSVNFAIGYSKLGIKDTIYIHSGSSSSLFSIIAGFFITSTDFNDIKILYPIQTVEAKPGSLLSNRQSEFWDFYESMTHSSTLTDSDAL